MFPENTNLEMVPKSLPKVDPEEMAFAVSVFQAGLRLRMPMESPENRGIDLGDAKLAQGMLDALPEELRSEFLVKDTRMAPKDSPLHRGIFGVLGHYDKHPLRAAIAGRVMAFYYFINEADPKTLAKWQTPCEEDIEAVMLHPAVMDAAATARTINDAAFPEEEFFALVEKIALEKYADE
jgi:hypothetical protein